MIFRTLKDARSFIDNVEVVNALLLNPGRAIKHLLRTLDYFPEPCFILTY
jgi:hypothetical protein